MVRKIMTENDVPMMITTASYTSLKHHIWLCSKPCYNILFACPLVMLTKHMQSCYWGGGNLCNWCQTHLSAILGMGLLPLVPLFSPEYQSYMSQICLLSCLFSTRVDSALKRGATFGKYGTPLLGQEGFAYPKPVLFQRVVCALNHWFSQSVPLSPP